MGLSREVTETDEQVSGLLALPSFEQRLAQRDVSPGTTRRLSLRVGAVVSAVLLVSLLGSTSPASWVTGASLIGICAVAVLCGLLATAWVWVELKMARALGPTSGMRFVAIYAAGGALVESAAMLLAPLAGYTSMAPPILRIISAAVVIPWVAITIGLLIDGRTRVRVVRRLLVDRAASIALKGSSKAALLDDLRASVQRDLQTELGPAFRVLDDRLAFEQQFATGHVDTAAAQVLRDLADSSVRPLSRTFNDRGTALGSRLAPISFITDVSRNQPFRPAVVSAIFVLTVFVDRWTAEGPANALLATAFGVALIFLILASGNRLMRAFPAHHAQVFLATFAVLQIPTLWRELATGAAITPLGLARVLVGVLLSACVIWATSGLGELRAPQAELLRLYARDLDAARIEVLAQTEMIGSITKDAARMLHGSVQSRLAACALAIEKAALTNDLASYAAAIEQARSVLSSPVSLIDDPRAAASLHAAVHAKVELWQGLASITALVSPEIKQVTGKLSRNVAELVEEGLCNAIRHGNADSIAVQVDFHDEGRQSSIRVRVVDDGCGPTAGEPGMGSTLLDELCEGRWQRTPAPGGGCVLDAWVLVREETAS